MTLRWNLREAFPLMAGWKKDQLFKIKLRNVLVRSRFHPVISCTGIEKVILQIHVWKSERYCLRSHWVETTSKDKIETYRFAKLVFGLAQSPFTLVETLDIHFEGNCGQEFWVVFEKIRDDRYVDVSVTGVNINEVKNSKSDSISLFRKGRLSYIKVITTK